MIVIIMILKCPCLKLFIKFPYVEVEKIPSTKSPKPSLLSDSLSFFKFCPLDGPLSEIYPVPQIEPHRPTE